MVVRRVRSSAQFLSFVVLGQNLRVDCSDPALRRLLAANYGMMASAPPQGARPDLHYRLESGGASGPLSLVRQHEAPVYAANPGDLLFLLEKDVTVELQKRRADLLFLHSAALEWQDNVCLLAAESGSGKSTTTWALLHHGFRYLSDELSPLDLESMQVFPYPHALCLKQAPPAYSLPGDTIHLGRTMHVPARSLPTETITEPRPLAAVFLVSYCPNLSVPVLSPISPAEASARLYTTALNALAHPNHGLDAVVRIAKHVPCFTVSSAELPATCSLIRTAAERAIGSRVA